MNEFAMCTILLHNNLKSTCVTFKTTKGYEEIHKICSNNNYTNR